MVAAKHPTNQTDASVYARSLYDGLEAKGFACFLDDQYYEAGHNLPKMQSQALRHSTKLLVVVSPRAQRDRTDRTGVRSIVELKIYPHPARALPRGIGLGPIIKRYDRGAQQRYGGCLH